MHIVFPVNDVPNNYFDSAELKEGEYSTVVIKQTFMFGTKYRYSIHINGEEVYQITNSKPREFKNMKLYAGDEYFPPSDCFIKNLKLNNIACKNILFFSFMNVLPKINSNEMLSIRVLSSLQKKPITKPMKLREQFKPSKASRWGRTQVLLILSLMP